MQVEIMKEIIGDHLVHVELHIDIVIEMTGVIMIRETGKEKDQGIVQEIDLEIDHVLEKINTKEGK